MLVTLLQQMLCGIGRGGGRRGLLQQCFNRCCPLDLIFVSCKSSFIGQCRIKINTILR